MVTPPDKHCDRADAFHASPDGIYCRFLQPGKNVLFKESAGIGRREGEGFAVDGDAHAVLAVAHAELAGQLDFIIQLIFLHQTLQFFNDLAGTLEVTAGTNADSNLHKKSPLLF